MPFKFSELFGKVAVSENPSKVNSIPVLMSSLMHSSIILRKYQQVLEHPPSTKNDRMNENSGECIKPGRLKQAVEIIAAPSAPGKMGSPFKQEPNSK